MKGATRVVVSGRDERTLWRRMENTPLRDLLMFKGFSGRLDIDWVTRIADLPERSAAVVKAVVKHTRLWTGERLDTAHELTAHFRDGLDAGRSEDELVASFGDVKQAAKLIRRATKRKRPLVWHVWRRGWQAVGCVLVVLVISCGWLIARSWLATPTISRDFVAEINKPVLATPESERAWPLYREAFGLMASIGEPPLFKKDGDLSGDLVMPQNAEWQSLVEYGQKIAPALNLIARGAERPELGYLYAITVDPETLRVMAVFTGQDVQVEAPVSAGLNAQSLVHMVLPHLSAMRRVCQFACRVEALDAARSGDAVRLERALSIPIGVARQMTKRGVVIEQLVGQSLLVLACQAVQDIARDFPTILGDDALARLSHRLAAVDPSPKFDVERYTLHDMAQRVFSDDGDGDGVMSMKGLADEMAALKIDLPRVVGPISASRRETLAVWDRWYDRMQSASRAVDWKHETDNAMAEFAVRESDPLFVVRHSLLGVMLPAFGKFISASHETAMRRDAACIGLAVEIHKRRHGSYPEALTELVPTVLPAVPKDCYDRGPLKYRVKDGRPEVYSVWRDGKDDGGVFEKPAPGIDEPDMRLWGW